TVQHSTRLAQKSLTEHLLQSDNITANLVKNVVHDKLSEAADELKKLSETEKLKLFLQKLLQDESYRTVREDSSRRALLEDPSGIPALNELEQQLRRFGIFVKARFDSLWCYDDKGNILAGYIADKDAFDRALYGKNFSYRDYFSRDGDNYQEKDIP